MCFAIIEGFDYKQDFRDSNRCTKTEQSKPKGILKVFNDHHIDISPIMIDIIEALHNLKILLQWYKNINKNNYP